MTEKAETTDEPQTTPPKKRGVPEGLWLKCPGCGASVYKKEVEQRLNVCPKCEHHFYVSAPTRIEQVLDAGTFEPMNEHLRPTDPLEFSDRRAYADRLVAEQKRTGMSDAVLTGTGMIRARRVAVAVTDSAFIMGSMGSVVGEVISRAIKRAYTQGIPLMIISQSGGARMMEGALSLMQMAKTSVHLAHLHEAGLPFISLMTNPTTGGVTASFAMLGDFNLAEPKALIGFAGPRLIRETIGQDLPKKFQRSEFLEEHGFIDFIVDRRTLKSKLTELLDLIMAEK